MGPTSSFGCANCELSSSFQRHNSLTQSGGVSQSLALAECLTSGSQEAHVEFQLLYQLSSQVVGSVNEG
jgi:hypothetical protein